MWLNDHVQGHGGRAWIAQSPHQQPAGGQRHDGEEVDLHGASLLPGQDGTMVYWVRGRPMLCHGRPVDHRGRMPGSHLIGA